MENSKFKNIADNTFNFFKKSISSESTKTSTRKFANSLWAILLGIIIASLFMIAIGKNPFEGFSSLIKGANSVKKTTWVYFGLYAFGAMAIGIAFKAGLFNIGVPGQMMAGGIASYFVIQGIESTSTGTMFLALIIAGLAGFIIALFVGVLKSLLNVHEVVSTILLNWIIFYMGKWFFRSGTKYNDGGIEKSKAFITDSNLFSLEGNAWIFSIIFVIVIAILMWFVMSKTTLGYKIRALGINSNSARYAGYKNKMIMMYTLAVSGLFAGIAGFIFYNIKQSGSINFTSGQPLSYGFDTIAISLLAYNSFLGIPIAAVLYSYLQAGNARLELDTGIGREFYAIIVGLIIYFAAISIIFNKFKPINFSFKKLLFILSPKYKEKYWARRKRYLSKKVELIAERKKANEFYLKNKKLLQKEKRKYKSSQRLLHNKILGEEMSHADRNKIYDEINANSITYVSKEDELGLTNLQGKKSHLRSLKQEYRSDISSLTNSIYNAEKYKIITKTKSIFIKKSLKGGQ